MKTYPSLLFLSIILITLSCNTDPVKTADLILLNSTVIHVDSAKTIPGQFIAINGRNILEVGPMAEAEDWKAKESRDLQGAFVMPGLWDNHVHFRGGDSLLKENQDLLPLFLAYGITTVRDAGGDITPAVLQWQQDITLGELPGPRIFSSGPKLDGDQPSWPGSIKVTSSSEITAALDSLNMIGADYVKIYDGNLSPEIYYEIIRQAEERGMKTTGHMPMQANLLDAVALGLDGTEHLYYVLKACSPKADSLTALDLGYGMVTTLVDTYDANLAEKVYKTLAEKGVYVTPTNYIGHILANVLDKDHSRDSLLQYVGPGIQKTYEGRVKSAERARASGNSMRSKTEGQFMSMVKPMHQAGIPLLAGSDSGAFNSYVYPGESLWGELQFMVKSGLTPAEALATSVINGPRFFDITSAYGSVAPGKRADLLILEENPLEDIDHLASMEIVIAGGAVYDQKQLDELLQSIKNNPQ
ncbi:amidohydrolase family protein [Zeaxanthinibacter sp. PT1]|uniref:amidohydrolase family protein n=1 Tax=Zeaxanthinibacter TaxID=561554 RepID=UPI00234B1A57|nr:amidohydrolase family protein [Zeaxanthinibacter sp. PT1]MDC6350918.1 amidohydrolase family protein [Zeaxanthinibacter sp. PT1]